MRRRCAPASLSNAHWAATWCTGATVGGVDANGPPRAETFQEETALTNGAGFIVQCVYNNGQLCFTELSRYREFRPNWNCPLGSDRDRQCGHIRDNTFAF